ncbi:hypothetical protein DSO57_1033631 [Entomophthora muscae]|uniref:Uncharacterized protein n=1 Tax=Entomophthora muscae TaxID=34485 RepID=A0ACC2SP15_9FUNG|nr:hypothetical protein DSO57_1033631 [Entomophthora muscae]
MSNYPAIPCPSHPPDPPFLLDQIMALESLTCYLNKNGCLQITVEASLKLPPPHKKIWDISKKAVSFSGVVLVFKEAKKVGWVYCDTLSPTLLHASLVPGGLIIKPFKRGRGRNGYQSIGRG